MNKLKSLVSGIGDLNATQKYYDEWSDTYDLTLSKWKYTVPNKAINLLKRKLKHKPTKILDLACGTGLFGEKLIKFYNKSQIYGSDISQKSIEIAKEKKIYKSLSKIDFEKKRIYRSKFDLVSLIGAMTYCKNYNKLFSNISNYLKENGHFIFSHRLDLWKKHKFINVLESFEEDFKIINISRPCNYLPLNKDFTNQIKVRLVLLQKN